MALFGRPSTSPISRSEYPLFLRIAISSRSLALSGVHFFFHAHTVHQSFKSQKQFTLSMSALEAIALVDWCTVSVTSF